MVKEKLRGIITVTIKRSVGPVIAQDWSGYRWTKVLSRQSKEWLEKNTHMTCPWCVGSGDGSVTTYEGHRDSCNHCDGSGIISQMTLKRPINVKSKL